MKGVAMTTSNDVVKFAQTSSGMRQNVIPGARIVMIVTRKLRAVMIDDAPAHWTPWLKKIEPIGSGGGQRGGQPTPPPAKGPPGGGEGRPNIRPAGGGSQARRGVSGGK